MTGHNLVRMALKKHKVANSSMSLTSELNTFYDCSNYASVTGLLPGWQKRLTPYQFSCLCISSLGKSRPSNHPG